MSLTPFWADPKLTYAKRNNLFTVQIDFGTDMEGDFPIEENAKRLFEKVSGLQYVTTSVQLPSFQIGAEVDRNEIGGSQRIVKPQTLDWTPIKVTFADFVESNFDNVVTTETPRAGEDFLEGQPGITRVTTRTTRRVKYPDASFYQTLMHAFYESTGRDPKIYQGARQIDLRRFNKIFQSIIITSFFENGDQ